MKYEINEKLNGESTPGAMGFLKKYIFDWLFKKKKRKDNERANRQSVVKFRPEFRPLNVVLRRCRRRKRFILHLNRSSWYESNDKSILRGRMNWLNSKLGTKLEDWRWGGGGRGVDEVLLLVGMFQRWNVLQMEPSAVGIVSSGRSHSRLPSIPKESRKNPERKIAEETSREKSEKSEKSFAEDIWREDL